jgi:hypothetical protein
MLAYIAQMTSSFIIRVAADVSPLPEVSRKRKYKSFAIPILYKTGTVEEQASYTLLSWE